MLNLSSSHFTLIDGKVMGNPGSPVLWSIYRYKIETEGSFLILKHQEGQSYSWTQLSGYSRLRFNESAITLKAGQFLDIYPDRLSIPKLASKDIKSWNLEGFSPEIQTALKEIPLDSWIEPSQMAEVYRSVAESIEHEKDQARLDRLAVKAKADAEDQKYKELFRTRHNNPVGWSEFLNNPDLSP